MTAIGQAVFPAQANGSFVTAKDGRVVGSSLMGQAFGDPRYFWGRPSGAGSGYDGMASGGPNLGPTSRALVDRVTADMERLRVAHGDAPIPADLVLASASGLDPDISPEAAEHQLARVVANRPELTEQQVRDAVARHTERPVLGFLGQSRVNVLLLNLDLDGLLGPVGQPVE